MPPERHLERCAYADLPEIPFSDHAFGAVVPVMLTCQAHRQGTAPVLALLSGCVICLYLKAGLNDLPASASVQYPVAHRMLRSTSACNKAHGYIERGVVAGSISVVLDYIFLFSIYKKSYSDILL